MYPHLVCNCCFIQFSFRPAIWILWKTSQDFSVRYPLYFTWFSIDIIIGVLWSRAFALPRYSEQSYKTLSFCTCKHHARSHIAYLSDHRLKSLPKIAKPGGHKGNLTSKGGRGAVGNRFTRKAWVVYALVECGESCARLAVVKAALQWINCPSCWQRMMIFYIWLD